MEKESLEDVFATEVSSGAKRESLGSHASPKVDETELQIMFPSKQARHRPCQVIFFTFFCLLNSISCHRFRELFIDRFILGLNTSVLGLRAVFAI